MSKKPLEVQIGLKRSFGKQSTADNIVFPTSIGFTGSESLQVLSL